MKWLKAKLKAFFYVAKSSITRPDYYKHVVKAPFSFSLKYLYVLFLFTSLLTLLPPAGALLASTPKLPQFVDKLKSAASNFYPSDLVLTFKDGTLSTNVQEPYYVDLPQEFSDVDVSPLNHIVTIDTTADVGDFPKYDTLFLLTAHNMVVKDRQGNQNTYRVYAYKEGPDNISRESYTFDRGRYDLLVHQVLPYFNYIIPGVYVLIVAMLFFLPFVIAGASVVFRLVYLLIATIFLFLIAKLLSKKLSYSELYRMAMHMLTIPILLGTLMTLMGLYLQGIWSFLILMAFGGYVISTFGSKKK